MDNVQEVSIDYLDGKNQITLHVTLAGDTPDGIYTDNFPQTSGGGLMTEGQYRNGRKIGMWSEYHPSGDLRRIKFYDDNGRQSGESIMWYSSQEGGGKRWVTNWENDMVNGLCEHYDPLSCGGGLLYSATYRNGVLHGPVTYASETDNIIEHYDNGRLRNRIICVPPRKEESRDDLTRSDSINPAVSRSRPPPGTSDSSPRSVSSVDSSPRQGSSINSSPRTPRERELESVRDRITIENIAEQHTEPIKFLSPRIEELRKS